MKTKNNNTTANEILRQLGGNKFIAMTGANGFSYNNNSLTFMIGKNKGKYKAISITLNPLDLYDIDFIKQKRLPLLEVIKETIKNVYVENMLEIIENKTGLDTRL